MSQILNTPLSIPGEGTVTSVSGGNNITITGNPNINPVVNVSGTTQHSLLIGNATTSITSLGVATNGQIPIGSSGANPVLATITAGANITVTNSAGSITIASSAPGTGTVTSLTSATGITLSPTTITTTGTIGLTIPVVASSGGTGLTSLTVHSVQVGNGTGTITQVPVGSTNTVLLGNTGADPSFGQVPNAALVNASVTLNNGNNISVTGSPLSLGGAASFNLTGTTNHTVQIGNSGGSLTSLGVGSTNTVLLGNTAADPSFGTVPNAALTNSSVTLNNGNNITVTGGGPLSLGGTASFNLTGTTNNSLQIGNAGGSITSLGVATNGQIPIGSTGATPVLATITAGANVIITNSAGGITIAATGSGSGLVTANADTGSATTSSNAMTWAGGSNINTSATGSTVTVNLNNSPSVSGSLTAVTSITSTAGNFIITSASSATLGKITQSGSNLLHTYGTVNTFLGSSAGNTSLTIANSVANVGIGTSSLGALITSTSNTGVGYISLSALTGGSGLNTGIGYGSGYQLVTGSNCAFLGYLSGSNYTTNESSNICIGSSTLGTIGESNVCRIGAGTGTGAGQLSKTFISGIYDTAVGATTSVAIVDSTGQIGSGSANYVARTSWTPSLNFGGVSTGITYTTQVGNYSINGNMISFDLHIVLSSKGAQAGVAQISGLPTTTGGLSVCTILPISSLSFTGQLVARVTSSTIAILQFTTAGTGTTISNTSFANTSEFYISGTYSIN